MPSKKRPAKVRQGISKTQRQLELATAVEFLAVVLDSKLNSARIEATSWEYDDGSLHFHCNVQANFQQMGERELVALINLARENGMTISVWEDGFKFWPRKEGGDA